MVRPAQQVISEPGDHPLPEWSNKESPTRDSLFELFLGMEPMKGSRDVNRPRATIRNYIMKFRDEYGRELRFVTRNLRPGWTRIWRIQ